MWAVLQSIQRLERQADSLASFVKALAKKAHYLQLSGLLSFVRHAVLARLAAAWGQMDFEVFSMYCNMYNTFS